MHASQLTSGRTVPAPDLLERLPALERDAISLARTERLTYRDVAAVLGISEDTAKRHIRSGLRRIRAEMHRQGTVAS